MRTVIVATTLASAIIANVYAIEANAATAKQIATAEQAAVLAACKFEFLKTHDENTRSPAFFSFMAECLTSTASK